MLVVGTAAHAYIVWLRSRVRHPTATDALAGCRIISLQVLATTATVSHRYVRSSEARETSARIIDGFARCRLVIAEVSNFGTRLDVE